MLLLRSALFNLAFYALLVGMLVIGIPLMLAPEQVVKRYARLWSRLSLRLLESICGVRLVYRGLEHVPPGGLIIAAKHQSFLDILALLPLAPQFTEGVPGAEPLQGRRAAADRARPRQERLPGQAAARHRDRR